MPLAMEAAAPPCSGARATSGAEPPALALAVESFEPLALELAAPPCSEAPIEAGLQPTWLRMMLRVAMKEMMMRVVVMLMTMTMAMTMTMVTMIRFSSGGLLLSSLPSWATRHAHGPSATLVLAGNPKGRRERVVDHLDIIYQRQCGTLAGSHHPGSCSVSHCWRGAGGFSVSEMDRPLASAACMVALRSGSVGVCSSSISCWRGAR